MMHSRAGRLNAMEVLRTLPQNEAFYFFEDIDKYIGKSASNLVEFCEMTKTVNKKSIAFHFNRHDFERWIKEALRDPVLAGRISNITESKSEEKLRAQIHKVSKNRLGELKNRLPKKRRSAHSQTVKIRTPKATKKKTTTREKRKKATSSRKVKTKPKRTTRKKKR